MRGSVGRDMWLSDGGGDILSGGADNRLSRIGDRDLYGAWGAGGSKGAGGGRGTTGAGDGGGGSYGMVSTDSACDRPMGGEGGISPSSSISCNSWRVRLTSAK